MTTPTLLEKTTETTTSEPLSNDYSRCGMCYTAANTAVRQAQTVLSDARAVTCHFNALQATHMRNMATDATTLAAKHHDTLNKSGIVTHADRKNRYEQLGKMMHNRVCPMLPSSMTLSEELSGSEEGQRAHAIKEICGPLCST